MLRATLSPTRFSVRLRVTLAFTAAMAVMLTAVGLFVYLRFERELDATVTQGLRSRADDVRALVRQADSGLAEAGRSPLTQRGESLAQILSPSGRVVDAPGGLRGRALLSSGELARASAGTLVADHPETAVTDNAVRLLATPVRAQDRRLIVVVGSSLEPRDQALADLGSLLLLGGLGALLLASAAGYGATAAALRPVESMRRRARDIRATEPGRRLPVPPTGDEIARLGETLNEMLDRLEHALARERTFVADASHELRTPLAILRGELELALRDAQTAADFRTAVESAGEETDRLVTLAEDMLVLARVEHGRLPVRAEDVPAAEVLTSVRERCARQAIARGATLTVTSPGELHIAGDRQRLEQAVSNMVDNASRHGGRRIVCDARAANGCVELHVLDDGPGFDERFVAAAFERFSRGDEARGRGGTGLGLAIVAAIARAHGGAALAANRPEGGADVWISLPR